MTESSPQGNSDELTPSLLTTYDLIICHENRIVFHEHYESPEQRQRACVWVLMESGVLAGIVTSDRSVWIMELHSSLIEQQQTRPPETVPPRTRSSTPLPKPAVNGMSSST